MFGQSQNWLAVLTILRNISQWEGLSHILWKIKMFETTNQIKTSSFTAMECQCHSFDSFAAENHQSI